MIIPATTGRTTAYKTTRAAAGRPLSTQPHQSAAVISRAAALTDDPELERLAQDIEGAGSTGTGRSAPVESSPEDGR